MASSSKTNAPWLHGPVLDLLTGCGGWSLPLILIATTIGASYRIELGAVFYFLAVFCNNPHYMATIYRAYGGKRTFNHYKFFSLYLTTLIVVAGIVAHVFPILVPWLLTIYLIWSPWHYTGQNFGISMMMTRRGGITLTRNARNLLFFSYCSSYVVWLVDLFETSPAGAITLSFDLPEFISLSIRSIGYMAYLAGALSGFAILWKRADKKTALIPPLLLHLSQFLWFMLPGLVNLGSSRQDPSAYFSAGVLAFMHCAQYLWITSYYAKRESSTLTGIQKKWSAGRYFGVLALGGIALFTPGPWLVSTIFRHDLFQSALIFTALVNIHHFMLDGAIWKLRDNRIARLLFGSAKAGCDDDELGIDSRPQFLAWLGGRTGTARITRWGLGIALIAFASADQIQNWFTLAGTPKDKVEIAQRMNPNDSRVSLRLAQHLVSEAKIPEAITLLQDGLERSPRNLAILHLLAQLQFQSSDIESAERSYDLILEITPKDLSALTNGGLIAMQKEKWQLAAERFQRANEVDERRWQTNLLLGACLYRLQRYEDAIEPLEFYLLAIRQAPETSNLGEAIRASNLLIDCYDQVGDRESANNLRAALDQLIEATQ